MAATLSTLGEREAGRANLDRAAEAYEAALTVYTRDAYPDDWASTYGNLGTVYWRLGQRENGTALLEKAVAAFQRGARGAVVARSCRSNGRPRRTISASSMPSSASGRAPATISRAAIEAHRAALTEYSRDIVPLDWAPSHVNLGAALTRLGERENDIDILNEAIAAYPTPSRR